MKRNENSNVEDVNNNEMEGGLMSKAIKMSKEEFPLTKYGE